MLRTFQLIAALFLTIPAASAQDAKERKKDLRDMVLKVQETRLAKLSSIDQKLCVYEAHRMEKFFEVEGPRVAQTEKSTGPRPNLEFSNVKLAMKAAPEYIIQLKVKYGIDVGAAKKALHNEYFRLLVDTRFAKYLDAVSIEEAIRQNTDILLPPLPKEK